MERASIQSYLGSDNKCYRTNSSSYLANVFRIKRGSVRVKISYSVDFEEVPAEVNKLVCVPFGETLQEVRQIRDKFPDMNELEKIEAIHEMRQKLSAMDMILDDCTEILSGYIDIKSQLHRNKLMEQENEDPQT